MFTDPAPAINWDAVLGAVETDLLIFAMERDLADFKQAA